ncbi:MAG: PrsW family intramembrane metalloprotease [Oscillospiraceae bacterium]|jgi:RsiW-degrading membrane proteinase PrsW (M82 family)
MGIGMMVVYVVAAVLPAVILLVFIYKQDKIEKEPGPLLLSLLFMGVLSALASIVLETIGETVLNQLLDESNPYYTLLLAFLVVAAVEEGMKMLFLRLRTWRSPFFNYRFDGIVYAVFVSLGFAAFENIEYVFGYGLSVAFSRAVLSIPGHMGFAVVMGFFYGRAKWYANYGYVSEAKKYNWAAYLTPVALHGFYDACAMKGTQAALAVFLIFVIAMYIIIFSLVKRESRTDAPIV